LEALTRNPFHLKLVIWNIQGNLTSFAGFRLYQDLPADALCPFLHSNQAKVTDKRGVHYLLYIETLPIVANFKGNVSIAEVDQHLNLFRRSVLE
jgi:hypothetical protein